MASISEKVDAEFENIIQTLNEIKKIKDVHKLSSIELGGLAAFIHNFYNGVENILKQILKYKNVPIPNSPSWHKDLVSIASSNNILSEKTFLSLQNFISFRHFFIHGYAVKLDPEQLVPLVESAESTFKDFNKEILSYIAGRI